VSQQLPVAMVDAPLALKALRTIWRTKYPTARVLQQRIEFVLDWSTANQFHVSRNFRTTERILIPKAPLNSEFV